MCSKTAKMVPKRLPTLAVALAWLMAVLVLSDLPVGQGAGVSILSDAGGDVYARCKSADDEIGLKKLPYGQQLQWSFSPNIQLSTLFWCNFSWYSPTAGKTLFASFDVWSIYILVDYEADDKADWKVEKDGFYFYSVGKKQWDLKHQWSANRANHTVRI